MAAIDRDDILEALGMRGGGFGEWFTPAIIGFGVGALVGATVALLFAPRSGGELRAEIMGKARDVMKRAPSEVSDVTHPERNY